MNKNDEEGAIEKLEINPWGTGRWSMVVHVCDAALRPRRGQPVRARRSPAGNGAGCMAGSAPVPHAAVLPFARTHERRPGQETYVLAKAGGLRRPVLHSGSYLSLSAPPWNQTFHFRPFFLICRSWILFPCRALVPCALCYIFSPSLGWCTLSKPGANIQADKMARRCTGL
jgi:hypothetical protein